MTSDNSANIHAIDSQALGVRAKLRRLAGTPTEQIYGEVQMTRGTAGAIVGALNKVLSSDDDRYMVLGWLFSDDGKPMSSKLLDDGHWYALYKWVDFWKDEDENRWSPGADFSNDVLAVYSAAVRKVYDDGTEAQEANGRDPHDVVDNAVGALGGKVTAITDVTEEQAPSYNSKPIVIPNSLRSTRFGSNKLLKERERRLLTELGYDPDEEGFEF